MDHFLNGQAFGSVAQRLLMNGMNPSALRPWLGDDNLPYITNAAGIAVPTMNATLRKDEWKQFDEVLLRIKQERLVGVDDLTSRGLVYNISNGLGTTVLEYEDMSDITGAQFSMDGATRGQHDRQEFDINYLPLPIAHKDFHFNIRQLESSRRLGAPLDTSMMEASVRKVREAIETLLFVGTGGITYGGGTIYGYMNHPDRNTGSFTDSNNWDDSSTSGEDILYDVRAMKQALINDGFYGPYALYIPTNFETKLDDDFKAASDKTIRQRIMEVKGIELVEVADKLTADNVVMVSLTSDVVRLVQGMPITPVEWTTEGGFVFQYKVMTIQVPQIRADQDGNCGIAHWT